MKRLIPALVLLFSLTVAALYIWKSSQKDQAVSVEQKTVDDKPKGDFVAPLAPSSDEKADAEYLSPSTKNPSRAITREDVLKMLEKQKKAEAKEKKTGFSEADALLHSSKTGINLIPKEQLREEIELELKKETEQPRETPQK